MELPDIEEENAALARTAGAQQQDDLPDIEEANAQVGRDELPDIEEANAQLQEAELPDIDVENGILAQKSQTVETPSVVQTAQPTAPVEQQPAPAKKPPDTHWQEMDERARQFNLGDAIYAAGEHIVEGLKGARDVIGSVANPVLKLVGDAAQGLGNLSAHGVVMPNGIAIGERGELGGNKLTPDELAVKRRNNIGTAVGSAINEGVDTIFPNEPNDNPVTAKIQKVGNEIGGLLRFTLGSAAALGAAEYGPTWNADYDAYIQAGKTPAEAAAWADLGGITNAIFAMGLKGIPVGHYVKKMFGWELPENLLKEAIDKAGTLGIKEVKAAMTRILAGQMFKNAVTEAGVLGGVSAAQTAATGAIQQLGTTGEIDAKALGKAALESGLHGAVTGATMAALPIAVKIPEARKGAEEPIRAAQEMRAAANASRFTPEQEIAIDQIAPQFNGDDKELNGRVKERIREKLAFEAVNGTPEGQTPLRERLDDPAEMEIEINKATEEVLMADNYGEISKSVNAQSLGTKADDRATQLLTAMPRTADKTESRIAGEIAAADPEMSAKRVWEVAQYLAAHEAEVGQNGQPLTKERIAEVEKAMVADKAGVVPVEQPDGTFKTVNEVEAEAARQGRKTPFDRGWTAYQKASDEFSARQKKLYESGVTPEELQQVPELVALNEAQHKAYEKFKNDPNEETAAEVEAAMRATMDAAEKYAASKPLADRVAAIDKQNGTNLSGVVALAESVARGNVRGRGEQKNYKLAKGNDLLKTAGLTGDYFTIKTSVITSHYGKDADHALTPEDWSNVASALQDPLVVAKYNGKDNSYRVWVEAKINGHYAVVGVEIKSPGKDMTVNAVKTVFGDERIDINKDDVVYSRKNGEGLQTLLGEPNSPEYSETPRVGNSIAQNGDVVNGGAKPVDHSGDWAPVNGKTGVFHTAEFPEVEIALQDAQPGEGTKPDGTPKKIAFIENLPDPATLDEAGQMKLGKFLYEQIGKADKMGLEEVNVGRDEAEAAKYMELVDKYKNTVKTEKFQVRADSVVGLLKKSGLASDVIATEAEFNEALAASGENGQALVADGKTYGFTDGTNVYLNPAFFSTIRGLNTPIHEFGHLAIVATKNVNRAVYDRALRLIKDTGYWKEVSEHPDYASLPDWKKAEEALTRLIAERGERLEATTPKGVIAEIKKLLVEIWKSFGNALGIRDLTPEKIEKMSVEDIADAIRAEMMTGREFGTRELSLQEGDLKAKILKFAKYQKPTSKSAKAALEAAKKAWKGLSEEQKTALGQYGDTSVLKTNEARTIANGIRTLREWDARRARISKAVKEQIKKSPNEGQKKIITASPQYYISEVTGNVTSPFAYAIDVGLPIPRKGDWGWDYWKILTDGMKYPEKRALEKFLGGEHPKHGSMDRVLSDYAEWLGIKWDEGSRDFEYGSGIEDFLDDILKERAKFERWKAGDRKTREEAEADAAAAQERRGGMTDEEFAEEDAWVRASEERRVEAERMGEQDDLSDMPDFSRGKQPIMMSRAIGPSALGDGKQKYYEVPFDKAVDKIVKNKKALSDEDVFVSQTPKPFQEIGLAKLPILMNQRHVLSCYFGPGEGVNQHHLHGLHNALKMLPRALEHPLMIIASESRPNDSVVAIVRLRDRNGNQMLAPIEINGVGREGDSRIDAHIASSFFGKKNAWTEMIATALRNEVDGKVSVFYLDSNEAKTIQNRLARDAFNIGRSELQSLSRSNASSTWHSITDAGSPVNGVISDQTQTRQFKDWFGKSKIVDADGKPKVLYHGTTENFTVFDRTKARSNMDIQGMFFSPWKEDADGYGDNVGAYYLSIQNPAPENVAWEVLNSFKGQNNAGVKAREELQRRGYDGVDFGGQEYIAFEPTQIKSATDNMGTFDPTNPDIRFSRGGGARLVGGRTRVAADQDRGERTPGGLAAARELADVRRAPVSTLGARRFLSLPISDLEELRKIVSEDVRPAHVARTEAGVARTEGQVARGKVAIWSDTIGVVDHTDAAAEKANLKAHGFFRDEDPNWCMGQSDAAIKAEKNRSDQQLARQLDALGERRMRGMEPGGQTAERGVFADEVAKVVLAQERRVGGRLGRLQTIGKSVQDAVARMPGMNQADAEWSARRFLDWAYGQPDYSRNMSGKQLTAEMFGKWLVMPRAVEQTAPEWANAIEQTIAADPKLADAFRTLADRRLNGDEYLMRRIRRQMDRQTEEALRELNAEKDEEIGAGSKWRNFEEKALFALHDTFAPVYVRMDYMTRVKIKAMKAAIRAANPADRPALRQQLDLYMGDLGHRLKQLELSRTVYERGTINEGSVYHREMVRLENEAHERWGLTTEDMSLYLDQWRVIETGGRSASFGEDVRQARKALDDMEARLGPQKWRRMQEYGNRFFAIHERELLNDPRAERMFGKAFIDYLKTQTHYVATERTFSVDELDAIEVTRRALRNAGVRDVDDVISQMFDYAGSKGAGEAIGEKDWTGRMTGSMAAKTEVRAATFKKVDRLQRALRRNQLVLDLREALTFAGVTGVRDLPRKEGAKYPEGSRYGHINYLENGEKRTLVVPKHIADAFKGDPAKAKWWSTCVRTIHNAWRAVIIDYNPAYRPMNIRRNIASIEKNMPGMRETWAKTVLRGTFPGAGALSDLVFDQMVKRIPASAKLFSDHTYFYYIPQMERICKILESPSEWQQKYWEALDANDLGKISQMDADWNMAKEMLRANMFVSIRSAYANEKSTSFAAEALAKKGLKTLEEIDRQLKSRTWKQKGIDNLLWAFRKSQQLTEHDDMMAKGIAYLADRTHYGLVRTAKESGDLVNRRVSIAQGERRGAAAGTLKMLVPFYNMIEKGVVRHWDAYRTDFGHTLAADGKFVIGSACSMLMAKGLAQLWMLRNADNDEEKARKKFGKFYDYAKAYHDAYRNCSEYVRKNYSFTPLWTDGYTSVILGGALTDEEKLLNPIVDFTVGAIAASEGLEKMPSLGSTFLDMTVRSVVPDLQMTGPLVEGVRLAFNAIAGENYDDYFRGTKAFDQKDLDMRFESWEDFKDFSAAVGGRAWNYYGGRTMLEAPVAGVDNGRGTAPESLETVLKRIPWISPVINRMVKIQVGSPERDGAAVRTRSKEVNNAIEKCAERLLKMREGDVGWHERHPKEYEEKLAEWQKTYGLSDHELKLVRARYLNALNQVKCIEKFDERKRKLIKREAKRQGCSEELIYIQIGKR